MRQHAAKDDKPAPKWGLTLGKVVPPLRALVIRLAEHDPVRASDIERSLTLTEIAEVYAIKVYDHQVEEEPYGKE